MKEFKGNKLFGCSLLLSGSKSIGVESDKKPLKEDDNILCLENIKKLNIYFSTVFVDTKMPSLYSGTNTIMINDILEDAGPLAGILSALILCKSQYLFVSTCDMEVPSFEVILHFAKIAEETNAMAVVLTDKNFINPFNAFYSKDIIDMLIEFLLSGGRRIQNFLEEVGCQYISQKELDRKFSRFSLKNKKFTITDKGIKEDTITTTARVIKVGEKEQAEFYDYIAKEKLFRIYINNELEATLNISPEHFEPLVFGHLVTRGYIKDITEITGISVIENVADVKIEPSKETQQIKKDEIIFKYEDIIDLYAQFFKSSHVFVKTKDVFSCAICMGDGILSFFEDIEINNAIDKAVGACVLDGGLKPEMFLLISDKLSVEIVKKAHNAGFSMVVSLCAPTDLAIEYAKNNDICIVGFPKNKSFNVYSNIQKIRFAK